MLEFRTITLEDKAWVDGIVMREDSRSADYNFGNIYIWDKYFKQLIAKSGDRLCIKLRYGGRHVFVFPIGSGPVKPAVEELKAFAEFKNYLPFTLYGVTEKHIPELEDAFPGCFEYTPLENTFDYIYSAEKLSTYQGKSLHGKKNHCNHFEKEFPDWEFKPITRSLIPQCLDLLSYWQEFNRERLDSSISFEHDAIVRAFAAYEKLNLEGGILLAGGRIVAFSVGELACADTFDVHFEKADININGAYTMICREMAKMAVRNHPGVEYINREDDMGIESLRTSKLSYKPEYLLSKYSAVWIK